MKNLQQLKKTFWYWLLAYAILGAIVYGLVYCIIVLKTNQVKNPYQIAMPSNIVTVVISKDGFFPKDVTIKKGQTVVWTNTDIMTHTVTADNNGPMSPELQKASTYSDTFVVAGKYSYYCKLHPTIKGTITVTE